MKPKFSFTHGTKALRDKELHRRGCIVGTGTSVEGIPLSRFDGYDFSIGLNETPKFYKTDYLAIIDERAVSKVFQFLPKKEMKVVMTKEVALTIKNFPPFSRDGIAADDAFGNLECFVTQWGTEINEESFCIVGGALSCALSLASWLGASECDIYGCDFYRTLREQYAYGISSPSHSKMIDVGEDRYTTPAMQAMVKGIEEHKAIYELRGTKFRNMNPLSELRCFEGGREDEW